MSDRLEVRINDSTVYASEEGRHVLIRDGAVVLIHTQPVPPPPPPPTPPKPAYDYYDPRFNVSVYELLASVARPREFINGKPVDWDWAAWSAATGRPNPDIKPDAPVGDVPDKSGTNLDLPGRRENRFEANVSKVFTFTVPLDRQVELVIASIPGQGYFNKISQVLRGPGRSGGSSAPVGVFASHFKRQDFLRAGSYTWTVSIDVAGMVGIQKV